MAVGIIMKMEQLLAKIISIFINIMMIMFENYAYDLKKLPFDNSDELDAAVEKFINYTNIKGKEA